ncbi:MAG: amino acid-binding ACT domain-containing protein [Actinomycetota bacterium]
MFDIAMHLRNEPGQLALMGETLGAAGVSVEGGGLWVVGEVGVAHFLVADGGRAETALRSAGIEVAAVRPVVAQRLDQDTPGQLGAFTRALAEAGVNIEVLYSDHGHQLIVVVDDQAAAGRVSAEWMAGRNGDG